MRLRPDVSTAETEYGMVLLDEAAGEYFHVNGTGVRVMRILLSGGTEDDAVRELGAEYDVRKEQARQDVDALRDFLLDRGLVER
jgi:hypothetical protein